MLTRNGFTFPAHSAFASMFKDPLSVWFANMGIRITSSEGKKVT